MQKYIYLYILLCSDKTYYTGVTNNLEKRLKQHQDGINEESYTHSRLPVELVYHELFTDFNLAFDWRTKIKKWSKAKKEALINGNYDFMKDTMNLSDLSLSMRINPIEWLNFVATSVFSPYGWIDSTGATISQYAVNSKNSLGRFIRNNFTTTLTLTSKKSTFGSKCEISNKFL